MAKNAAAASRVIGGPGALLAYGGCDIAGPSSAEPGFHFPLLHIWLWTNDTEASIGYGKVWQLPGGEDICIS